MYQAVGASLQTLVTTAKQALAPPAPTSASAVVTTKPATFSTKTMTPEQLKAYGKAMEGAAQSAQAASATAARTMREKSPAYIKWRKETYATLQKAPYPPPPPPIVKDAQAAAASARERAQAASTASSQQAAVSAANQASVSAMTAIRKASSAPNNPEATAAAVSAQASLQTAGAAVAKWTKESAAVVVARLKKSGNAGAEALAKAEAGAQLSILDDLAQMWARARLDWRFWTGLGAAIYGTWLRYRSSR
jgi:hypothetical protein